MNFNLTSLSSVWFLAMLLICVLPLYAYSVIGRVEIDVPYNEILMDEEVDALMIISNTGTVAIPYRGSTSGYTIHPEQAVIKWFNRSEGLRTPLGEDNIGLKINWNQFRDDSLSTIPTDGSAFFRISTIRKPIYDAAPPRDSIIIEIIVGEDSFLSSDIVKLPATSEVDLAGFPSIATLKWSDGRSISMKRANIGGEQFLFAVTPETSSTRRVARIPPGCDVSVSHVPLLGTQDGVFTQTMIISFIGGDYEDLVYNWARYQVVSGHPETVPNAYMRLSKEEATAEEARICIVENLRKPWLKYFGKSPFQDDIIIRDEKSQTNRNNHQTTRSRAGAPGSIDHKELRGSRFSGYRSWIVWLGSAIIVLVGGWTLLRLVRTQKS